MNTSARISAPPLPPRHSLSLGLPVIAEPGSAGFDWLLIDLEHGCVGEASLFQTLQALRGSRSAVIVRVGAPHPDLTQRVLDWGRGRDHGAACGPRPRSHRRSCAPCASRPTARAAIRAGAGLRLRPGAPRRRGSAVVLAQIESVEAVARVREIAAVDGIDALFVGPADLSFDLKASSGSALTYDAASRRSPPPRARPQTGGHPQPQRGGRLDALAARGYTLQAWSTRHGDLAPALQGAGRAFPRRAEAAWAGLSRSRGACLRFSTHAV